MQVGLLRRWERERLGDVLATLPELPAAGELVLTNLGDVDPEEITWLWTGRIPFGKLTLMGGDLGCGKSYVSMALIAAITNGVALPDDEENRQDPGEALILNFEDAPCGRARACWACRCAG